MNKYYSISTKIMVTTVFFFVFIWTILALITLNININYYLKCIILLFILYLMVFIFYYMVFSKIIGISSDCIVSYNRGHKKQIKWSQVREVGIVIYAPFPAAHQAKLICISEEQGVSGRKIASLSNSCIYLSYSKKMLEEIKRHWQGEVIE